jgi:hypothetical protein
MYEDIWSKGNFPKEWSIATVIPILKPGKNPTNAESYRPISLTSCLCKVLEMIVNKRLEERNLLPSQQYGFRKKRSTTDVLIILENISRNHQKRQSTAMVFLDISKAYDMCWRYNILKKNTKMGKSIENYYTS